MGQHGKKFDKKLKSLHLNVQAMQNIMTNTCVKFRAVLETDTDWLEIVSKDIKGCKSDIGYEITQLYFIVTVYLSLNPVE
jgi:hypothetical protein